MAKRQPRMPTTDPSKARRPGPNALTLEQLEPPALEYPRTTADKKRMLKLLRLAVEGGNLLALHTALLTCIGGPAGLEALQSESDKDQMVELPAWLFLVLSVGAYQSVPFRRGLQRLVDRERARRVVELREIGVTWEDVYERAAKEYNGNLRSARANHRKQVVARLCNAGLARADATALIDKSESRAHTVAILCEGGMPLDEALKFKTKTLAQDARPWKRLSADAFRDSYLRARRAQRRFQGGIL